MESKSAHRFSLGRQSSLKPDNAADEEDSDGIEIPDDMDIKFHLMCLASEGDAEGIEELHLDLCFHSISSHSRILSSSCLLSILLSPLIRVQICTSFGLPFLLQQTLMDVLLQTGIPIGSQNLDAGAIRAFLFERMGPLYYLR